MIVRSLALRKSYARTLDKMLVWGLYTLHPRGVGFLKLT
jgi:hypothetical protein